MKGHVQLQTKIHLILFFLPEKGIYQGTCAMEQTCGRLEYMGLTLKKGCGRLQMMKDELKEEEGV